MLKNNVCYTAPPITDTGAINEVLEENSFYTYLNQDLLYVFQNKQQNTFNGRSIEVYITDMLGRVSYQNSLPSIHSLPIEIPLSQLGNGMYLISLIEGNEKVRTKKFIISR